MMCISLAGVQQINIKPDATVVVMCCVCQWKMMTRALSVRPLSNTSRPCWTIRHLLTRSRNCWIKSATSCLIAWSHRWY